MANVRRLDNSWKRESNQSSLPYKKVLYVGPPRPSNPDIFRYSTASEGHRSATLTAFDRWQRST